MYMKNITLLAFLILYYSCTPHSETDKYQKMRNNIVNVQDRVREIEIEDVYINHLANPYIMGNYLIIKDYKSTDKQLHLFDKNDFTYLKSFADKGEGPDEITNMGLLTYEEKRKKAHVPDLGKLKVFSYDLDSVLLDDAYKPSIKTTVGEKLFPHEYICIDDTLSLGMFIERYEVGKYNRKVAKWNMQTGEIKFMDAHPLPEDKSLSLLLSPGNKTYIECYYHHDLMTIRTIDGELKYSIYGPKWEKNRSDLLHYYGAHLCKDKIVAFYSGEKKFVKDSKQGIILNCPSQMIVFDLEGNYLKTLETGYPIARSSYDADNHRLIMTFDDEIQFAYLDLEGII